MSVLKKPIISEKVSNQNEMGKYGFIVDINANKIMIKKEVEKMYNVKVVSVNTMRYGGKTKSKTINKRAVSGKTAAYKKATVSVKQGDVIDFYTDI